MLFADPRTYKIVNTIRNTGNYIAATLPAQQILPRAGIPSPHKSCQYLPQNDLDIKEFIEHIAEHLS